MAKRYRAGLANYRARTAASAFRAKPGPRPDSKTGRKLARKAAARGRLPKPGTAAAERLRKRYLPDTEEVRWLKRSSLGVILDPRSRGQANDWQDELDRIADENYRAAYNAQAREKRADRKAAKPKGSAVWTWVRRHKRRLRAKRA